MGLGCLSLGEEVMRGKSVPQEAVLAEATRFGVITPEKAAEILLCHWQTTWYKLEGLVQQGFLIRDEYNAQGMPEPQHRWRYAVVDPL